MQCATTKVRNKIFGRLLYPHRREIYTKYPLITASFHDLITDGTMPNGKSFSAFQNYARRRRSG